MSTKASVGAALLACTALQGAQAAPDWVLTGAQQAELRAEKIVVAADIDRAAGTGSVRAAVLIAATASTVYAAMTDCTAALQFVPQLRRCVVLESDPAAATDLIEHEADPGWLLPAMTYVFRTHYVTDRSIDFKHVSGDFRENEGRWELVPVDESAATIVTYRVRMVPRIPVPEWMVRAALKRQLPELMRALRRYTEAAAP